MNEMIIPGTDKILLDGTILVLSGFDGVKYIMHNGFYNYAGEMFEGWYGVSIPDQNIIPVAQQMLLGCEIFYYPNSNCSCRFPNGNIPYTTDDKFQLQRAFITVDTMYDRDSLAPTLSITELPNGKMVRVNKPNNLDFDPKYYIYRYNEELTGAYWEEYKMYILPADGIPKSDLSEEVQDSLNKADTALQEIPIASAQALGGVRIGDNLSIDPQTGVLSSSAVAPTYFLNWYVSPTQEQINANLEIINEIRNLPDGSYNLYLKVASRTLPLGEIVKSSSYGVVYYFESYYNNEVTNIYTIQSINTSDYSQIVKIYPDNVFDESSFGAASMSAIANYIDTRIGTTGNLDPDSYASASDVSAIEDLIPSQASDQNQLADKDFVNSTVATNTAYFVGTFDSIQTLTLYDGTVTNNDYAFVVIYNSVDPTQVDAYDRFKYNNQEYGYIALDTLTAPTWEADTYYEYNRTTNEYVLTESEPEDWSTNWNNYFVEKSTPGCWKFEYELNNSSFTAEQWAAINSGMTASLVTRMNNHMADTTIHVTAQEKTTWNAKYDLPPTGIPSTDLSSGVQASLGKADSALQSIPPASAQTLGGVKVGDNLDIDQNGVLSADEQVSSAERNAWDGAIQISGTLILPSTGLSWTDNQDGTYSQFIVIPNSTANTKVDLQVSVSVIEQMQEDKITALYILNDDGVFYAVAVGNAPTDTITVQYTRTEVVTS